MTKHQAKPEWSPIGASMLSDMGNLPGLFSRSAHAYQKAVLDWQKELTVFFSDRLQEDTESLQSLAEGRTFPELLKIQQDWLNTAMRDYSQEGSKLMEIVSRFASAGFAPKQE